MRGGGDVWTGTKAGIRRGALRTSGGANVVNDGLTD
jgi:hypothetical protein